MKLPEISMSFFLKVMAFVGLWLVLLSMNARCLGQILWANTAQTVHWIPKNKTLTAQFEFTNPGPGAVTITDIKTSCGCTVAQASRMRYSPGEKGEIDVMYNVGDQIGVQGRTIAVSTDEPQHPIYTLSLTAYLPEPFKINPRYVYWEAGSKANSQTINLSASPSYPVKVLSVVSNNPGIKATLVVEREGAAYAISVQPMDTKAPVRGMLTIETDLQLNGKNRKFFAYADVRPAANSSSVGKD